MLLGPLLLIKEPIQGVVISCFDDVMQTNVFFNCGLWDKLLSYSCSRKHVYVYIDLWLPLWPVIR